MKKREAEKTEQSDTAHDIQPGSGRDLFFLDKIILVLSDVA